jgi:hypothetical protein
MGNVQLQFHDDGKVVHCDIHYKGPLGQFVVRGTVNKEPLITYTKKMIASHGYQKTAAVMGCRSRGAPRSLSSPSYPATIPGIAWGIADEINTEAKCQALQKASAIVGWSPWGTLKKAGSLAYNYNPATLATRYAYRGTRGALSAMNPFKRKGGAAPEGGPESPEESTPEEDASEADASSGYELMQKWDIMGMGCNRDSSMGDFDIGSDEPTAGAEGSTDNLLTGDETSWIDGDVDGQFPSAGDDYTMFDTAGESEMVGPHWRNRRRGWRGMAVPHPASAGFLPAAMVAYQERRRLAKIAKSGNPRAANAAKVLHKAKSGDPKAKAKIKAINRRAKAGDPKAKDAMARLHTVNKLSKGGNIISQLFREGIT